jgi:diguanylate cyclase (GGDEF)-like protein
VNVSIIFFDVDNFKNINDTLGHNIGDSVLIRIAEILKVTLRESDFCARWGGEEFIIACEDSSIKDGELIAEKLRFALESDRDLQKVAQRSVTASFGVTNIIEKDTLESVIKRVDDAMYQAKEGGKNRVVVG